LKVLEKSLNFIFTKRWGPWLELSIIQVAAILLLV
jgi:hypothetical protein